MRKIIICSVPMKEQVDRCVYSSGDTSVPVSDRAVCYPICAFLEKTLKDGDELKVLLLAKQGQHSHSKRNADLFRSELAAITEGLHVKAEYTVIDTDFAQALSVHEQLMGRIVDALETGAHILVDTTFGPKDLPIVIFTALHFAEKFLGCKIDNILYGQASFVDGHPVDTRLCDITPLYCLSAITNLIRPSEPEKARGMLKALLSH